MFVTELLWSPDSRKLFTVQTDDRQVRSLPSIDYVPQDGTVAPRAVECRYALPGDQHITQYRLLVIDVSTSKETVVQYPMLDDSFVCLGPFSGNRAWWCNTSDTAYFIDMSRGQKVVSVVAFDTETGVTRRLFEERAETYLCLLYTSPSPRDQRGSRMPSSA